MKVLMTADAVGGVWTYALELCKALAPRGIDVLLATMGPSPDADQRREVERIPNVRLTSAPYKLEWMLEPWSDVAHAGRWLLDLARDAGVDVVHLNGYVHAALPWKRPVLVVAHSCVRSWWRAVHGVPPPDTWDLYRQKVERGLDCADAIVSPTAAFLAALRENYTFNAPAHVVHNARTAAFESADARAKEPFILASGRLWDEAKNIRVLDDAARDLAWPVIAVGETTSPDGTPVATQYLHCIGRQPAEAVAALLQRAEIFVHPALYEPFGYSVLEAAQAGCALVLADIPTLRELWSDAALFVNPHDPAAVRAALRLLTSADAHRRLLGHCARERAKQLACEQMGQDYHALYEGLITQSRRRRSVA